MLSDVFKQKINFDIIMSSHEHFLPHPFQFTRHKSFYYSTLYV